jgi:manganese transport protein
MPSFPDAFRSVAIPAGVQLWRKICAFGPGFIIAVGDIDPGNWATGIAGGTLGAAPAIAISNLLASFLQALALIAASITLRRG